MLFNSIYNGKNWKILKTKTQLKMWDPILTDTCSNLLYFISGS